jgi:hypothetical protein
MGKMNIAFFNRFLHSLRSVEMIIVAKLAKCGIR